MCVREIESQLGRMREPEGERKTKGERVFKKPVIWKYLSKPKKVESKPKKVERALYVA